MEVNSEMHNISEKKQSGGIAVASPEETDKIKHLFDGWEETMIYSCLQGVMGKIYIPERGNYSSAAAFLGDFCFLAGKPERRLAEHDYGRDFLIVVPQNEEWSKLIEDVYSSAAERHIRFAVKKEPDCFDVQKLRGIVSSLDGAFTLAPINEAVYSKCREIEWCRDFVDNFPTYEVYKKLGVGFVIMKDGEIASGASSYTRYKDGIEIQIETGKKFRRCGLAAVCGAALILECLERGLYPAWDAHTPASLALAQKLGYRFSHEYPVYLLGEENK